MSELNMELEDFIEFTNNFSNELRAINEQCYAATKKNLDSDKLKDIVLRAQEKVDEFKDLPNVIKHEGQLKGFDVYKPSVERLEGYIKKLRKKIK